MKRNPLTKQQRVYLETLLSEPNFDSGQMRIILKNNWYSDRQAKWLNKHSDIHTQGTKYEKK